MAIEIKYEELTAVALKTALQKLLADDSLPVKTGWAIGQIARGVDIHSGIYNAKVSKLREKVKEFGEDSIAFDLAELKATTFKVQADRIPLEQLEGKRLTPAELAAIEWAVAP